MEVGDLLRDARGEALRDGGKRPEARDFRGPRDVRHARAG